MLTKITLYLGTGALLVALLWLWGRDNERALETCQVLHSRGTCLNLISR